ncbi:MAG: hypothetical protein WCJ81_00605 [bacterium]
MNITPDLTLEDVFIVIAFVFLLSLLYRQHKRRIDQKADVILQFHLRWAAAIETNDEKVCSLTKQAWHDWLLNQDMDIVRVAMTKVFHGSPTTSPAIERAWAQMQNMLPQIPSGINGIEC